MDFKSFTEGDGCTDEPKQKRKYVKRECRYYSIDCKSYGSVLYSSSFRKSRFVIIQNYSGCTASEFFFHFNKDIDIVQIHASDTLVTNMVKKFKVTSDL